MFGTGIIGGLRRFLGLKAAERPNYFYEDARKDGSGSLWKERWQGTGPYVEFRTDDDVLDVGCAEGMIAFELARSVKHVHGIEVLVHRVEAARRLAAESGISNFTVEAIGIDRVRLEPLSYDVVLFQGVYGMELASGGTVGPDELSKALRAARRQVILRLNVQDDPRAAGWLPEIFETADRLGFDVAAFPKFDRFENLIVASRRGSGARLRQAPQLMLVPTRLHADHPVVAGAPLAPWRFGRPDR